MVSRTCEMCTAVKKTENGSPQTNEVNGSKDKQTLRDSLASRENKLRDALGSKTPLETHLGLSSKYVGPTWSPQHLSLVLRTLPLQRLCRNHTCPVAFLASPKSSLKSPVPTGPFPPPDQDVFFLHFVQPLLQGKGLNVPGLFGSLCWEAHEVELIV